MSEDVSYFPLAAFGLTAFTLVAALFISADFARAADVTSPEPGCSCPESSAKKPLKPKLAGYPEPLDESDEIAALESLHFALTEVGDGATYVWKRSHGRLSGLVKPTRSYKNADGAVCRTAVMMLNGLDGAKTTELSACRLANGTWQIL
ncbi:MAG: hypothetical protein ACT4OU_11945 [Hyphomicrobium sp.]